MCPKLIAGLLREGFLKSERVTRDIGAPHFVVAPWHSEQCSSSNEDTSHGSAPATGPPPHRHGVNAAPVASQVCVLGVASGHVHETTLPGTQETAAPFAPRSS